jgi:hypothetical protein
MNTAQTLKEGSLFEQVAPLVALAAQWMGVRAAYLRSDGRDFIMTDEEWSNELNEKAAAFSVALQRSLVPSFEFLIEGGYEPLRGAPPGDYRLIFERP